MSRRDKRLLFWMGIAFVAFAAVIARAMTGTWLGLGLFVLYIMCWLSPLGPTVANYPTEQLRAKSLEKLLAERDAEIKQLRAELGSNSTPRQGADKTRPR